MKVKSESEVAQSCPTPSDPMDWAMREVQSLKIHSTKTRNILVTKTRKICLFKMWLSNLPAMQETWVGSISGLGRSPGEGKGYPLQYSGLEISMDSIVHGIAKSLTWLSDFHPQNEFCHVFNLNVSNLTTALFIFQKFNEKPQKHSKTIEQVELKHYMFHIF